MLRSEFNGFDIVVGEPNNLPQEITTRDATGAEVTSYRTWADQGRYPWQVTKTNKRGVKVFDFVGYESSKQAALKAAQEQASCAPRDRRDFLTKI